MDLGPSMPSWQLPQVALSSSLSPIFRFGWLDLVDDGEFSLQVGKALYFASEIPKFWYWSPAFLTLFAHFTCKLNQLKPSYIILNRDSAGDFPILGIGLGPLPGPQRCSGQAWRVALLQVALTWLSPWHSLAFQARRSGKQGR